MSRIGRGRARTGASRITVTSVAREAGVSAALIHNHYPSIAERIRQEQGHGSRAQRDAKHQELKVERAKARALRREIEPLRTDVRRLSSINEVLLAECASLRWRRGDDKVVPLKPQKTISWSSAWRVSSSARRSQRPEARLDGCGFRFFPGTVVLPEVLSALSSNGDGGRNNGWPRPIGQSLQQVSYSRIPVAHVSCRLLERGGVEL